MVLPAVSPKEADIIKAYRHLYRGLLHAVQFSKPSRFTARDQLRDAFRKGDRASYDQYRIDRTIDFLQKAAMEKGLEHKLVKNLIRVEWERRSAAKHWVQEPPRAKPVDAEMQRTSRLHYELTIKMLNDSMQLCLR